MNNFKNIKNYFACVEYAKLANACFRNFKQRMYFIIFEEHSTTTRLFFGFFTFLFGVYFLTSPSYLERSEYAYMMKLAPYWLWGIGFIINGTALFIGAYTNKYSKPRLILEGILGVVVWIGSAYAVMVSQNTITAHVATGIIAFWIYVRYPTHWEGKGQ